MELERLLNESLIKCDKHWQEIKNEITQGLAEVKNKDYKLQ